MRKGLTAFVAGALLASGCGSPDPAATSKPPSAEVPVATAVATSSPVAAPSSPQAVDAADSIVPAVKVVNLANDADFQLTSLIPAERPVLLWFWAPH